MTRRQPSAGQPKRRGDFTAFTNAIPASEGIRTNVLFGIGTTQTKWIEVNRRDACPKRDSAIMAIPLVKMIVLASKAPAAPTQNALPAKARGLRVFNDQERTGGACAHANA